MISTISFAQAPGQAARAQETTATRNATEARYRHRIITGPPNMRQPCSASAAGLRANSEPGPADRIDLLAQVWDHPTMKLTADAKGRLAAAELFKPGRAFDASLMPDGSIRIIELSEKPVPEAKVTFRKDGTISLSQRPARASIIAALRADRDAR
jgi:hypothetical protein